MPLRMDGCVEDDTGMRDGSPLNAAAGLSETSRKSAHRNN